MREVQTDGNLINGRCLVIPGAQKAGTTAVFSLLRDHPGFSEPLEKEPQVLSLQAPLGRPVAKWYSDVLNLNPPKLSIDASTSYLMSALAAERVGQLIEDPLILIMIRDPARRAFSAYMELWKRETKLEKRRFESIIEDLERSQGPHLRNDEMHLINSAMANGQIDLSYTDAGYHQRELGAPEIDNEFEIPEWPFLYFSGSIYSESVERFENLYPGRVMVAIFEEFVQDPNSTIGEILKFVGLGDLDLPTDRLVRYKTLVPKGKLGSIVQQSKMLKSLSRQRAVGRYLGRFLERVFFEQPKLSGPDYVRARNLLKSEYEYWFDRLPATKTYWV